MRRRFAALGVAAGLASGAGPAAPQAAGSTYVGRVQGTDAFVAIARDGRKVGGYLCDSGEVSRWIRYGWLRRGRAPLVAGTTGRRLGTVRIAGRAARGTVRLGGERRAFRARRVRPRDGGLHFAVGKQPDRLLVAGWILLPDGSQRGAVSRLDTRTVQALAPVPAPRLDPDAGTVGIGGDGEVPPVEAEPQQLVVVNIIAIFIGLLVPVVTKP